jgi:hypothetical protein
MKKTEIFKEALEMNRDELIPSKICKTKLIHVTKEEFCELYKHLNGHDIKENCDCNTIFIGDYIFKKRSKWKII